MKEGNHTGPSEVMVEMYTHNHLEAAESRPIHRVPHIYCGVAGTSVHEKGFIIQASEGGFIIIGRVGQFGTTNLKSG